MPGDPVFDQLWMSQMPSMISDNASIDENNRADGVALLRKIGPAILLTHSRSGDFGWEIADDAPELVKGIVSVEPWGPPCYRAIVEHLEQIFQDISAQNHAAIRGGEVGADGGPLDVRSAGPRFGRPCTEARG